MALAPNRLSCHTKVQGEHGPHETKRVCIGGGGHSDDSKGMWDQWRWQSVQWMHIDTVPEMKCWSWACPVPGVSGDKDGAERFTSLTSRLLGIS